jgi:hypothetical protein
LVFFLCVLLRADLRVWKTSEFAQKVLRRLEAAFALITVTAQLEPRPFKSKVEIQVFP